MLIPTQQTTLSTARSVKKAYSFTSTTANTTWLSRDESEEDGDFHDCDDDLEDAQYAAKAPVPLQAHGEAREAKTNRPSSNSTSETTISSSTPTATYKMKSSARKKPQNGL